MRHAMAVPDQAPALTACSVSTGPRAHPLHQPGRCPDARRRAEASPDRHHPAILADSDQCPICTCLARASGRKWRPGVTRQRGQPGRSLSNTGRSARRTARVPLSCFATSCTAGNRGLPSSPRLRPVDAIAAMDRPQCLVLSDADDRISPLTTRGPEPFTLSGEHGPLGMRFTELSAAWRNRLYVLQRNTQTWLS